VNQTGYTIQFVRKIASGSRFVIKKQLLNLILVSSGVGILLIKIADLKTRFGRKDVGGVACVGSLRRQHLLRVADLRTGLACKDVANTAYVCATNSVMSRLGFAQEDLSKQCWAAKMSQTLFSCTQQIM
jgi:hypothetical protein